MQKCRSLPRFPLGCTFPSLPWFAVALSLPPFPNDCNLTHVTSHMTSRTQLVPHPPALKR